MSVTIKFVIYKATIPAERENFEVLVPIKSKRIYLTYIYTFFEYFLQNSKSVQKIHRQQMCALTAKFPALRFVCTMLILFRVERK